jgi:hypothetical protein
LEKWLFSLYKVNGGSINSNTAGLLDISTFEKFNRKESLLKIFGVRW